ncbi:MAG: hypothetical protein IT381_28375 [Deltaproteobacteria bacterium]|nr:hypothetical protein [Deltaproteobacteria bacterium]
MSTSREGMEPATGSDREFHAERLAEDDARGKAILEAFIKKQNPALYALLTGTPATQAAAPEPAPTPAMDATPEELAAARASAMKLLQTLERAIVKKRPAAAAEIAALRKRLDAAKTIAEIDGAKIAITGLGAKK